MLIAVIEPHKKDATTRIGKILGYDLENRGERTSFRGCLLSTFSICTAAGSDDKALSTKRLLEGFFKQVA